MVKIFTRLLRSLFILVWEGQRPAQVLWGF